ncbi:MAG: HaeII family restriction endonuclease, partial [Magnetococcales bacterium]|nr:HaeII family restriction endonuclease [Magnetococcales bacterium]
VSSDRVVIVCKDAEKQLIVSILNQIGWKSKIQSIITENNLIAWYEKALRGEHAELIGDNLLKLLQKEIESEFPVTRGNDFSDFMKKRNYLATMDSFWQVL